MLTRPNSPDCARRVDPGGREPLRRGELLHALEGVCFSRPGCQRCEPQGRFDNPCLLPVIDVKLREDGRFSMPGSRYLCI